MNKEQKQINLTDSQALSQGFAKHLKQYADRLTLGYTQTQCNDISKTVVKAISELTGGQDIYHYEKGEYTCPEGYHEVMEAVDVFLNRRIHSTTLERIADEFFNYVDNIPAPIIAIHTDAGRDKAIKARLEIDTEEEKKKISTYLLKTWDGFSEASAKEYVNLVWDESAKLVKAYTQGYGLISTIENFQEKRRSYEYWQSHGYQGSEDDFRDVKHDDILYAFPMAVLISAHEINSAFLDSWDYSKAVDSLIYQVKPLFAEATKWRPKGWSKMQKNYEEYDGMSDFSTQQACEMFGGYYSGSGSCGPFPERISLPHVMYSDKKQGSKPLEVLTGSILAQVMALTEHNNDVRVIKTLEALEQDMDKPHYWIGALKELSFVPPTDDTFVQAAWKIFLSKAAYEKNDTLVADTLKNLGVSGKKRKYR